MKKFLSLTLALLLILSMTATAFADEEDPEQGGQTDEWNGTYASTTSITFEQIVKTYDSENNVVVNETLKFTSVASDDNPDATKDPDGKVTKGQNLTVDDLIVNTLTLNSTTGKYEAGKLSVTIPSLSKAGIYVWTITEDEGSTAGVNYSNASVVVTALVEYNNAEHKLQIASCTSYIKKVDEKKTDTFENTFKSGSFTVEKDVTGNMANLNDEFEITVTLTSTQPIGTIISAAGATVNPTGWTTNYTDENKTTVKDYTYEKTLTISKNSGKQTFSDIPVGVKVTVSEKDDNVRNDGYKYVSTKIGTDDFTELTIADGTNAAIVVTNEKTASVETGVSLDTVPYFLMLAVACVGMFLLLSKKRAYREN